MGELRQQRALLAGHFRRAAIEFEFTRLIDHKTYSASTNIGSTAVFLRAAVTDYCFKQIFHILTCRPTCLKIQVTNMNVLVIGIPTPWALPFGSGECRHLSPRSVFWSFRPFYLKVLKERQDVRPDQASVVPKSINPKIYVFHSGKMSTLIRQKTTKSNFCRHEMEGFCDIIRLVEYPRKSNAKKHGLIEMLVIAPLAVLPDYQVMSVAGTGASELLRDRSAGRVVAGIFGAIIFGHPNSACGVRMHTSRCSDSPTLFPSFEFSARLFSLFYPENPRRFTVAFRLRKLERINQSQFIHSEPKCR